MPDDWVSQNAQALIAQIDQFVTALNNPGGLTASGLTAPNMTSLTNAKTDLQAKFTDQQAKEAAFRGAVDATEASQDTAEDLLRQFGRAANNNPNMTDTYRNAAGLTVRDTEPTPRPLPVVEDLAVVGRPNGNNFLDWSVPAGEGDGVTWEVETALGASGNWTVVGATSRTDFLHENAGAGTHRLYRVIAKRGNRKGEPGNEAAVYG